MTWQAGARMTAQLNAMITDGTGAEAAARAVVGGDVAHHVIDPDQVLGLDPWRATDLDEALPELRRVEAEMWILTLPVPGRLGALRGPAELNAAALEAGATVLASGGKLALVPHRVGPAVQWRVFQAERPFTPATPYDAERALSETIIAAAATLTHLDVPAGRRPTEPEYLRLPSAYGPRRQGLADRAARLLEACSVALVDDGGSITSYEADTRDRELRTVRDAATEALCSAVTWLR